MEPGEAVGFLDDRSARELFEAVRRGVEGIGDASVHVDKSQIAFRRRRTFAAVWVPARYLRGRTAPLVLTVYLPFRELSRRWKEVVEPAPGRFTHHLELFAPVDVDDQVLAWLRAAWEFAA